MTNNELPNEVLFKEYHVLCVEKAKIQDKIDAICVVLDARNIKCGHCAKWHEDKNDENQSQCIEHHSCFDWPECYVAKDN